MKKPWVVISCQHPFHSKVNGVSYSFPCGKCVICRSNRAKQWIPRIYFESLNQPCAFVTLTYNEENLPRKDGKGILDYRDIQLFFKRLRKSYSRKKLRYYGVGEYGPTTYRPHWHFLLFGLPSNDFTKSLIESSWGKGFVTVDKIHINRIKYLVDYINPYELHSDEIRGKEFPPRSYMSRRPGIGAAWLTEQRAREMFNRFDTTLRINGTVYSLPRYYRDRIYIDEESRLILRERAQKHMQAIDDRYHQLFDERDRLRGALRPTHYQEIVDAWVNYLIYIKRKKAKI